MAVKANDNESLPLAAVTIGGMGKQQKSVAAPILAALATFVLLGAVLYPLGYFFGCQVSWMVPPGLGRTGVQFVANAPATGPSVMVRKYSTDAEAIVFLPAAKLESWMRRSGVHTASPKNLF